MHSLAAPAVALGKPLEAPRLRRLSAVLLDAVMAVSAVGATTVVAFGWLMLSTGGGTREPEVTANTVAFAIVMAGVPAWLGLVGASAWWGETSGATPGQVRSGLAVEGAPAQRLLRVALHPLGAAGWWWLAAVAALATVPVLPLLLTSMGVLVLAGGVVSAVLLIARPGAATLHDRMARTRMVAR